MRHSKLRIWRCHSSGLAHCCGTGLIPWPRNFHMWWALPKKKKKQQVFLKPIKDSAILALGARISFPPSGFLRGWRRRGIKWEVPGYYEGCHWPSQEVCQQSAPFPFELPLARELPRPRACEVSWTQPPADELIWDIKDNLGHLCRTFPELPLGQAERPLMRLHQQFNFLCLTTLLFSLPYR